MKIYKLLLLFIGLFSVHFNNAMDDQQDIMLNLIGISTKYGLITKFDHRNLPPEMNSQLIIYSYTSHLDNIPTIHIKHDLEKQEYFGGIEGDEIIIIQDQIKLKTMVEQLEAKFNAALNQINMKN